MRDKVLNITIIHVMIFLFFLVCLCGTNPFYIFKLECFPGIIAF